MSSANQQINSLLATVAGFVLLGGVAASFGGACVSSSSGGGGSGGAAGSTVPVGAGGSTSQGGANGTGGATSALPDCTLTTGVVTGNACTPTPSKLFTIQDNTPGTGATGTSCPMALWANDGTSSGYFFLPWCNSSTASDCTLSMACSSGTIHVTGNYQASGGAATVDGNGGFGLNLQTTFPDAGPGCQIISGAGLSGVTLDVTNTILPNNHFIVGLNLANGNQAEYTANLAAGAQTVPIPWSSFKNKNNCGGIPGPGIVGFYFAYDWFNDGVAHTVDMTMGNLGFY